MAACAIRPPLSPPPEGTAISSAAEVYTPETANRPTQRDFDLLGATLYFVQNIKPIRILFCTIVLINQVMYISKLLNI